MFTYLAASRLQRHRSEKQETQMEGAERQRQNPHPLQTTQRVVTRKFKISTKTVTIHVEFPDRYDPGGRISNGTLDERGWTAL